MDYTKYFKKGGWAAAGRYYAMHPSKLKELFTSAKKYATKDGLKAVKDEFLFICQYIRDVFTGNYKEYNFLNLTVIVFGNLDEQGIDLTGFVTYCKHLQHQRRKHSAGNRGLIHGLASFNTLTHL